jgi:hypothetical protein
MFVLLNDGGMPEDIDHDIATRILIQRGFVFGLLTSGIAVALLHGAEFRDSKVGSLRPILANFLRIKHRYSLLYSREDLASTVARHFRHIFGMWCGIALQNSRIS